MNKKVLPVFVLISLAGGLALAQKPEGGPLSTEALIERLSSESFAEREQAARLLQERGPRVLPALRKAAHHRDAEVRRHARALIPLLELAAALEPKRVSLPAGWRPLSLALQEIEKQTGYKVAAEGKEETNFEARLVGVPFWEALERIQRDTGHVVSAPPLERGLRLTKRKGGPRFTALAGPFRVEVLRLHEDRDLDLTEPGEGKEVGRRDHRLTLTLSILAEPRFIILGAEQGRADVALQDDGKALATPPPLPRRLEDGPLLREIFRQDCQYTAEVLLRRASEKARSIRVLRGSVLAHVVVERKPVVVSESLLTSSGTRCQVGSATLEIARAEQDEHGRCHVSIVVPPDRDGLPSRWLQRVHVADAAGNRYTADGHGNTRSGERHEILLSYPPAKDSKLGPPSKLIIEDWVIAHHPIPFEFKDLPLP